MSDGYATWGSATHHERVMVARKTRKLCRCGCRTRVTHSGFANGVCLISGCEWSIRRWVHEQRQNWGSAKRRKVDHR